MRKLIIKAALVVAIIGAISGGLGGLAFKALNGGSSGNAALAASQDQQDIFSSVGSAQDSTPSAEKPWLGASIVRTADGLTVSAVIADSPADKAGLQRGDVIKAVDGTAVSDMAALLDALQDKKPGDTVTLSITRDGVAQEITATLEARPEPLLPANPVFPELNGIPRDQLFSHMLGGSFQFKDKDGATHTATVDLGTVSAVDNAAKKITVQLNTGGDLKTYDITGDVLTMPSDLSQFQSGDNVTIISVDGSLRAVSKGRGGFMPFFGKGHGGPRHFFGDEGLGEYQGEHGLGLPGRGGVRVLGPHEPLGLRGLVSHIH